MKSVKINAALLAVVVFYSLPGCTLVPVQQESAESSAVFGQWRIVDAADILNLQALFEYAEELPTLSSAVRIGDYQELIAQFENPESVTVPMRVRLGLLLGGVEPSLVDYERAQQELRLAYQQAIAEPLLADFIRLQMRLVGQHAVLDKTRQRLQTLEKQYRRQRAVINRQKAASSASGGQQSDQTVMEGNQEQNQQPSPAPSVVLADLEWQLQTWQSLRTQLTEAEQKLRQRDAIISEQDKVIEVLEAKIKALSAIERNINQRTQEE